MLFVVTLAFAQAPPLPVAPCDAELITTIAPHDELPASLASKLRATVLGCVKEEKLDAAERLATVLGERASDPMSAYVVAKALLALRKARPVCDGAPMLGSILEHVVRAKSPEVASRLAADPDFAALRTAGRFRWATGESDAKDWLVGSVWFPPNPANGTFMGQLDLNPGGVARRTQRTDPFEETFLERTGTWAVDGDHVVLTFDGASSRHAIRAEQGHLGAATEYQDVRGECD